MKILFCGDTHVKKDNIEPSRRLILWLVNLAKIHNATILFAGDQHDSMGVVRAEVIEFWDWAYETINKVSQSISITGNHDLSADSLSSAMTAHKFVTQVIDDSPAVIDKVTKKVWGIGFIRDFKIFHARVMSAYEQGARVIVCHAEFNGAQFENGFYSPHGFDTNAFPSDLMFVSGHIHKKQSLIDNKGITRVLYPGSPRMLTRSDIGQIKTVTLWDIQDNSFRDIEVPEEVCPRFKHFIITPDNSELIKNIPDSSFVYVDIKGPKDFIQSMCKKISDNVKLRTLLDQSDNTLLKIKESEGIPSAFSKYLKIYKDSNNLSQDEIIAISKIIYEKMPELRIANG